tara:strand:- start:632 stop:1000 length:369 start_codon:yes stop_codon:yes gene_type:complete
MELTKKQTENLNKLFDDTDFIQNIDYDNCISYLENDANKDTLLESLEDYINEYEIIYYFDAMKYLLDNDASLVDSLSIASSFGYDEKSLDSEILATLHYQKSAKSELLSMIDDICEILNIEE